MSFRPSSLALAGALLLSACAQTSGLQASDAQLHALESVRQSYESGQYADVTREVGLSVELQSAPTTQRVEALKLQAYSYCLLDDKQRCERSFSRLLALDPAFELPPNERHHPMWGPVFEQARQAAGERS